MLVKCNFCEQTFELVAFYHKHLLENHRIPPSMIHNYAPNISPEDDMRQSAALLQPSALLQPPAINSQQTASHTLTTMAFSNGVRVRASSTTDDDSNQPAIRVDSPHHSTGVDSTQKECPVCFMNVEKSEHVFYPCTHSLCQTCFNKWEKSSVINRCPICRQPYNSPGATNINPLGASEANDPYPIPSVVQELQEENSPWRSIWQLNEPSPIPSIEMLLQDDSLWHTDWQLDSTWPSDW